MLQKPNVVCFGEILWDILPTATQPGGAPMNVAYHLNQLGIHTTLISRVGADERGEKLTGLLRSWNLSADFCQTDTTYATSEVHAVVGEHHEVSYNILFPVAWDHIEYRPEFRPLLQQADALVFGSLATRNAPSRETLHSLLETASYKVFDINLRAPNYTPENIERLLYRTDLLKLNVAELEMVTHWFHDICHTDSDRVKLLQDKFGITEVLVTRGSSGASYYTQDLRLDIPAYKVPVADTVGSGDAFLAGFLAKRLQGAYTDTALCYAVALGAYVTMHHGACPAYSLDQLEAFKTRKEQEVAFQEQASAARYGLAV
ncbi:carbohydrate kinase [Paraflavisolibacter sp. H34]|uniref:carbohydrate kinase family protein n=1 Tax=Huijunlia imazamoxiresistens TaxID=3127457 RepID=UPI003016A4F5